MPKKAPKMSEEERLQWEADKAAAEADAERAEKEMILNYMKDKLAREEKYSRLNNKKLIEKWRSIMRQSKSAELKKELQILSHTFERIMDRKDAVTQQLARDLEESEEQSRIATRAHQRNLQKLIEIQNAAVNDQQDRYHTEINMETSNFNETAQKYVDKTQKSDHDFDTMMCALEQTHIDRTSKLKQEFQSLRDEIKNNTQDEKHALRISLEAAVEKLFKMFQQAQKDYDNSTLERRKEFEKLQAKDAKSSAEIELQMNKLAKIQENINIVKQKMVNNTKEYEEKHAGLKENKDHLQTHFRVLRTEMGKQRNKERELLTKLTLASEEALKRQKNIDQKASKILKIGEMCRKLETEEEQVLPFGIVPPTPRTEEEDKALEDGKPNPVTEIVKDYEQLEGFWRRYNKVKLDRLALEAEKVSLEEENMTLRSVLKQYLDGVSVNSETLKEPNPLFVVNQRTNVKFEVPQVDPRVKKPVVTVVEAAHAVKHTHH
ncbi:unnamed protein product [Oikopleura dioica]|uniref:Dynein regulatory complex protein 1 n=1 Tax=Oikopleura dioica TaxID=34765 RepID=E4Y831_OIKDI|nr:unnamed protein product [Oikopleura dioica]